MKSTGPGCWTGLDFVDRIEQKQSKWIMISSCYVIGYGLRLSTLFFTFPMTLLESQKLDNSYVGVEDNQSTNIVKSVLTSTLSIMWCWMWTSSSASSDERRGEESCERKLALSSYIAVCSVVCRCVEILSFLIKEFQLSVALILPYFSMSCPVHFLLILI